MFDLNVLRLIVEFRMTLGCHVDWTKSDEGVREDGLYQPAPLLGGQYHEMRRL